MQIELLGLSNGNRFLLGERATWADFVLASHFEFYDETVYEGKFSEFYPQLSEYTERVKALPGVKEHVATRP